MTDIFISYATKDKNIADNICQQLEKIKFKCWIAPRDIQPGEEYPAGIVRGIDNCKCMVVIFSAASNASKHVLREVERAVDNGTKVIPFRIEDIMPSNSMAYFLKLAHWLDAKDMKLEKAIKKLASTIASVLNPRIEIEEINVEPFTKQKKQKKLIKIAAFILLVLVTGFSVIWYYNRELPDQEHKRVMLEQLIGQNKDLLTEASALNINSTLDISIQIPNHQLKLKAWVEPEKSQFIQGDKVKFKTILSHDAYLVVYVHSMDGSTYPIYPNSQAAAEKIKKDLVFIVGIDEEFELEIDEPFGIDVVQFIATTDEKEFSVLLANHTPLGGTNIESTKRGVIINEMRDIKKRGIKIVKSNNVNIEIASKLWGETLVLLNTSPKE